MRCPPASNSERGSMLIIALIVVLLMTVLVTDVTQVSMVEYEASVNGSKLVRLEYALDAGLEIAKAHLIQDGIDTEIDSQNDSWAQPIKEQLGGSSGKTIEETATGASDSVDLLIEIEDESAKWPLPLLVMGNDAVLKRRRDLLAAVIDAFREDTNYDVDGSQALRYAELIASFMARREGEGGIVPRPNTKSDIHMTNVADIALIKEIDDRILYDEVDDDGQIYPGLLRFLTIWSYDVRVNVNTAPRAVLRGLFRGDDRGRADDIYNYRTAQAEEKEKKKNSTEGRLDRERKGGDDRGGAGKDGQQSDDEDATGGAVFEKVADVQKVEGLTPRAFNEASQMMTVSSKTFSVWVTASTGSLSRIRHWVVRREGARIVVLLSEAIDGDYRPRFRKLTREEEDAEGFGR
jgi:type II secretory pathway component PulK